MFNRKRLIAVAVAAAMLVPAAATAQEDGAAVDCSAFQAGAVVHFQGPYTQQLLDGAIAAANECGASITTAGPPAFTDPQEPVTMFQDMVAAGADAIVVVAFPAEFWIRPIDEAVADGVVVSTYDVESPASLESLHTAPKQKDQGRAMADVLADALIAKHGEDPQGTVYVGICLPGLELIEARIVGFRERMAERVPSVEIPPNFDVAFDQTENYARWNDVIDQNPGGLAYVGYCENDLPSLVRIKEADPEADYEIASIGINPDGLKGIADGTALAAIGQKPFMQGYVAMRAMLDNLAAGTKTPRGWIDVRPEVVTAENVAEVTAREDSLSEGTEQTQAYYQPEIDALFDDINSHVQSFADLLGD